MQPKYWKVTVNLQGERKPAVQFKGWDASGRLTHLFGTPQLKSSIEELISTGLSSEPRTFAGIYFPADTQLPEKESQK